VTWEELEGRLVDWATARDDVRTLIVVGSRARPEEADEWSDLDVAFATTDRRAYLGGVDWLDEIGEVWLAYVDPLGTTRHVLFAGGLDAGITPLSHRVVQLLPRALQLCARRPYELLPALLRGPLDRRLDVFGSYTRRGVRVLVDKDGAGAKALAALPVAADGPGPPGPARFRAAVHELFFLAVWSAKHLRRGERWAAARLGVDGRMKGVLLEMVEWHARACGRPGVSPGGRRLEDWADPALLQELRGTFAHYDEDDLWRATFATIDLFRRLAKETAERLGLPYDETADRTATEWLVRCEAERRYRIRPATRRS
jgi:aminoglycoside 6-adenylyltransferase